MKLKQLEYLVKIVECGSITQAAQQLYISQPSLTKAVSSLESEYGIQLLIRKPRGVELTPQGRDFVHHARGILASVKSLETDFTESAVPRARLFVASQQLEFIYDKFLETYANNKDRNLCFNLTESDRNEVVRHVLDGKADVCFAIRSSVDEKDILWNSESKKLDVSVIDKGGVFIAVGPKSPLWKQKSVGIDELEHCTQAALDMEDHAKQVLWTYKTFNNDRLIFFNSVSACEHFLMNTDGYAYISPWTGGCFKASGIHIIPVEYQAFNELIWIKRVGEPLSETEAFFLDCVYRHLGKTTPAEIQEILNK